MKFIYFVKLNFLNNVFSRVIISAHLFSFFFFLLLLLLFLIILLYEIYAYYVSVIFTLIVVLKNKLHAIFVLDFIFFYLRNICYISCQIICDLPSIERRFYFIVCLDTNRFKIKKKQLI